MLAADKEKMEKRRCYWIQAALAMSQSRTWDCDNKGGPIWSPRTRPSPAKKEVFDKPGITEQCA